MMSITGVLAIYGAVVSTITAAWNLYRDFYNRSRELRKKLTEEVYSPVRRQLTEALEGIQKDQRAFSIDTAGWKKLCSTGITRKLKPQLKAQLEALYERTLPGYDKSWQALNEEIGRVAGGWDGKYADVHDYQRALKEHNILKIDWWKFLVADAPVTPIDGLRDGDVLRLWNAFMTPARFKLLDRSPEQFLTDRWHEATRIEALRQFRDLRKRALEDVPKAIELLDRSSLY